MKTVLAAILVLASTQSFAGLNRMDKSRIQKELTMLADKGYTCTEGGVIEGSKTEDGRQFKKEIACVKGDEKITGSITYSVSSPYSRCIQSTAIAIELK